MTAVATHTPRIDTTIAHSGNCTLFAMYSTVYSAANKFISTFGPGRVFD